MPSPVCSDGNAFATYALRKALESNPADTTAIAWVVENLQEEISELNAEKTQLLGMVRSLQAKVEGLKAKEKDGEANMETLRIALSQGQEALSSAMAGCIIVEEEHEYEREIARAEIEGLRKNIAFLRAENRYLNGENGRLRAQGTIERQGGCFGINISKWKWGGKAKELKRKVMGRFVRESDGG